MQTIPNKVITRRSLLKQGLYGTTAAALWLTGCSKRSSAKKPNIILVSVDTLRAPNLSCYGYDRKTSPNIDAFAANGMLFKNCFSQAPVTGPSCASFITGFLPHELKITNNTTRLAKAAPTIAEALKQTGYKTYAVVSNYVLKNRGFKQGFDIYNDKMDSKEITRKTPERIAANTNSAAIDILKQHTAGSFYMWIHYQDPHGPYTPPAPYTTMFTNHNRKPHHLKLGAKNGIPDYQKLGDHTDYHYYVSQYDGEIAYLDHQFGLLIDSLKANGLYDDTVIIFTADHGEALGENNRFFAHGHDLSNSQLHVPFIVKAPTLPQGVCSEYAQLLDIAPTIFAAASIKTDLQLRGRDILTDRSSGAAICSELNVAGASLIIDGLKLIMYGNRKMLFDITKDPLERNNLAANPAYNDRMNRMIGQLIRMYIKEDTLNLKTQKPANVSEEQKQKLRSLGYVD